VAGVSYPTIKQWIYKGKIHTTKTAGGAPAMVAGAAGFGAITSAGDPRILQFGLKLNF
jgi:hypothetical protein